MYTKEWGGILFYKLQGNTWVLWDSVRYDLDPGFLMAHTILMDRNGHFHVANEDPYRTSYGTNASGTWQWMWVDSAPGNIHEYTPSLFVDRGGVPHLFYKFEEADNLYHYARFNPFDGTWIVDTTDVRGASNLVVDPEGYVHFLTSMNDTTYHMYRDPGPHGSWHREVAMPLGGGGNLAIDSEGYLHAALIRSYSEIYYLTTRPDVGTPELQAPTENEMKLSPGTGCLYITGYQGLVRVYDPVGRLILSQKVSGRARLAPLSPGVYLVVAGEQSASAVVR